MSRELKPIEKLYKTKARTGRAVLRRVYKLFQEPKRFWTESYMNREYGREATACCVLGGCQLLGTWSAQEQAQKLLREAIRRTDRPDQGITGVNDGPKGREHILKLIETILDKRLSKA